MVSRNPDPVEIPSFGDEGTDASTPLQVVIHDPGAPPVVALRDCRSCAHVRVCAFYRDASIALAKFVEKSATGKDVVPVEAWPIAQTCVEWAPSASQVEK